MYRGFDVYQRLGGDEVVVYRCFEDLVLGGFAVQSADRVRLPVDAAALLDHERRFWELLIEAAPQVRHGRLFPSVAEAIADFDAGFGVPVTAHIERLRRVNWHTPALDVPPATITLVRECYLRLVPFWPEHGERIWPGDAENLEALRQRLSPDEQALVEAQARAAVAHARARGMFESMMMIGIVRLIVLCGALVEAGRLPSDEDPSLPLLELLEAGHQLGPHHGGVDIFYQKGTATMSRPTRAQAITGVF